jgi:hypothetical protein
MGFEIPPRLEADSLAALRDDSVSCICGERLRDGLLENTEIEERFFVAALLWVTAYGGQGRVALVA